MKRLMIAAIVAAGLFVAIDSNSAPAQAAPIQSGVAQTVLDDHGFIEQAHYRSNGHRYGRHHGHGWRHGHCGCHYHHGWHHHRHYR